METFNLGYYYKDQSSEVCFSYVQKSSAVQQLLCLLFFLLQGQQHAFVPTEC